MERSGRAEGEGGVAAIAQQFYYLKSERTNIGNRPSSQVPHFDLPRQSSCASYRAQHIIMNSSCTSFAAATECGTKRFLGGGSGG